MDSLKQHQSTTTTPEVFGPARLWDVVLGVGAVAMAVASVHAGGSWPPPVAVQVFVGFMVLIVGFAAAHLVWRVPELTFSEDGLHHRGLLRRTQWRWGDMGPAVLSVRHHLDRSKASRPSRSYYLVAFTDESHDVMVAAGEERLPSHSDCDFCLTLTGLTGGGSKIAAQHIVDRANHWRERFGRPEVDAPFEKVVAYTMTRDDRRRARLFKAIGVPVLIVLGFLAAALILPQI